MNAVEIENIVRKVLREELLRLRDGERVELAGPPVIDIPVPRPSDTGNPFLMSDGELRYAERQLPPEDRPILRMRVMSARLESQGQHQSAAQMRTRADRIEKRIKQAA